MERLHLLDILMVVSTVIWILALVIYNLIFGGIDFGHLDVFAVKSVVVLFVACSFGLFPWVGGWLQIGIWWIGIVVVLGMEWWEARILVAIIWILNLGGWLIIVNLMTRRS